MPYGVTLSQRGSSLALGCGETHINSATFKQKQTSSSVLSVQGIAEGRINSKHVRHPVSNFTVTVEGDHTL